MTTPAARVHGGFHSAIDVDHPDLFIDSCMQIWPDADFATAHRHGVAAYGVTAFEPHDDFATAVERVMFWHLVARRHPNLYLVHAANDIRQGKRDGRAGLLLFAQGGDFIGWKLHRIEKKEQGAVTWELYDLSADPQEENDLSGRETARLKEMKSQLEAWLESVTGSLRGDDYAAR